MKQRRWLAAVLLCGLCCAMMQDNEPKEILLWPKGAPGSEGKTGDESLRITDQGDHVITHVNKPSIIPYLPSPDRSTGVAIIMAPGGGHSELWISTKVIARPNGSGNMG